MQLSPMLSAKLIEACTIELILSDEQQRNCLLDDLDRRTRFDTELEANAKQLAKRFCQSVFDKYPFSVTRKKGM